MSSKVSLSAMAKDAKKKKKTSKPASVDPTKKQQSAAQLSAEFVQETDDGSASEKESDEDDSTSPEPATPNTKTNGKLPSPEESSNESESDEAESSNLTPHQPKGPSKKNDFAVQPRRKHKDAPIRVATAERPPYKAPSGFESESLDGDSTTVDMLKDSSLSGKQIWYFTAPAAVPISTIKKVSLLALKEGKSVLEHDGDKYHFKEEAVDSQLSTQILVPEEAEEGYQTSSRPIDRILHLQQIVDLPGIKKLKANAGTPFQKVPRPQPKGLRMRFHPVGFDTEKPENIGSPSSSEDSDSDVEMEDAPKTFKKYGLSGSDREATDSAPEDSDSNSDEETAPPPTLPTKFKNKAKPVAPSTSQISTQDTQPSLKRKHGDDKPKKSKSLSNPVDDVEERKAKRTKTKTTILKPSASIESFQSQASTVLSSQTETPKASTKPQRSRKSLKPLESSHSSLSSQNDTTKVPSAKKTLSTTPILPPSKNKEMSLKDLTKATDLNLTPDKKRKKLKTLKKKKDPNLHSQAAERS